LDRIITPARILRGRIRIPGDKSISHRALILGALARGDTRISHPLLGEDVRSTRRCLEQAGIRISEKSGNLIVHGRGMGGWRAPASPLDCGNSGTTMRLLSGILAAMPFRSTLVGDASLSRRPMKRIIDPLGRMGAKITAAAEGTAPLEIDGTRLSPIDYITPVASAQIKSCVLLAGLFADGTTSVTEPSLSRDHTERMLRGFGVDVSREGLRVSVTGPAVLQGCEVDVPGDISSAAFFLIAASLLPDSEIRLENVGLNPSRTGILEVLDEMGADIERTSEREINGEPRADLIVRSARLKGTVIEGPMIPTLIDEIPILAVAAARAEGRTEFRNAGELRVKETDRIAAIASNLESMGVRVDIQEDGFVIEGPQTLHGADIETFQDHRIAMSFAVAGLAAQGGTRIRNAECAEISYRGFYETLGGLIHG